MNDYPVSYKIKKIINETHNIKTIYLNASLNVKPGQFLMVWLPGVDEKPFVPTITGKETAITIKKRGFFTKKLFALKKGDLLGLRGPYGHGFEFEKVKNACIVAAGIGIAAVVRLAEELALKKAKIDFVYGCKSKKEILFQKRLKKNFKNAYCNR